MATETISRIKRVTVTKELEAAAAYAADDVLSETDTASSGTDWDFDVAHSNFRGGYIVKAEVYSETESITPRLVLWLFNAAPTCELDDNAASSCPTHADLANYVGCINFPTMEDFGDDSYAMCTPSTTGNLPLAFTTTAADTKLYGVLITRDAFTQTATDDMTVVLTVEQH